MVEKNKKRLLNIELLRIVSMLIIISCHYTTYVNYSESSYEFNKFLFANISNWGCIGVDIFIVITCYFACEKNFKVDVYKVFQIVLTTSIYTFLWGWIAIAIGKEAYTLIDFIKMILSPFMGTYWFVTAYICFYFLLPFFKSGIENLTMVQHKYLLILYSITICAFQMVLGELNVNYGMIATFTYIFLLVSYLKKKKENIIRKYAVAFASVCYIIVTILSVADFRYGLDVRSIFCTKSSIFVILFAISVFYVFHDRIKIESVFISKIVGYIAPTMFGVYILHAGPFSQKFVACDVFNIMTTYNAKYFVVSIFVEAFSVFFIGIIVEKLRALFIEKTIKNLVYNCSWLKDLIIRYNNTINGIEKNSN